MPANYHLAVRHFILVLMIALLPLRGWIGDAMATDMAIHAASTQLETAAPSTPGVVAADANQRPGSAAHSARHHASGDARANPSTVAAGDCLFHNAESDGEQVAPSGNGCENCAACQACHTVALGVSTPISKISHELAVVVTAPNARFASADTVLGQKPPIS